MSKQKICSTPCNNCSCKGWTIKNAMEDPEIGSLYDLRCEWKLYGKVFQCYKRNNGDGCHIHYKQILWIDNNIERVKRFLFPDHTDG